MANNLQIAQNFYSWGNGTPYYPSNTPMKPSTQPSSGGVANEIILKEDLSTPELDYVLDVDGKERGRIVIPESENIPNESIENLFN